VHSYKQKTDQASYGEGILTQALNAIRNGMSLKKASKEFGISRHVLRKHRGGKVSAPAKAKFGRFPPPLLPEFENKLVAKVQKLKRHFSVCQQSVMMSCDTMEFRSLFLLTAAFKIHVVLHS